MLRHTGLERADDGVRLFDAGGHAHRAPGRLQVLDRHAHHSFVEVVLDESTAVVEVAGADVADRVLLAYVPLGLVFPQVALAVRVVAAERADGRHHHVHLLPALPDGLHDGAVQVQLQAGPAPGQAQHLAALQAARPSSLIWKCSSWPRSSRRSHETRPSSSWTSPPRRWSASSMHEVEQICDSIVVLRSGKTAGTVDLSDGGPVNYDTVVNLITGNREIAAHAGRRAGPTGPLLEVRGLGDGQRLHDISLDVRKGEIVGIAGLQGQGQEELLLSLAGFRRTIAGEVSIDGRRLPLHSPRQAIAAGVVVVPGNRQTEGLFMDRPVFYNATFPAVARRRPPVISRRWQQETSSRLIANFSIKAASLCTPVTALSGGNAQKLVVSKWLPLEPKVLLMSDPAKGIDVQAKAELYGIVVELAEKGAGILLFASDLRELVMHCDRILVLYEGRVVEEVPGAGLDEETLLSRCLRRGPSA